MAPPQPSSLKTIYSQMQKNLGGLRKPDRGISADDMVDPAKITEVNTLMGKHLALLAQIQQQHAKDADIIKNGKERIDDAEEQIKLDKARLEQLKKIKTLSAQMADKNKMTAAAAKAAMLAEIALIKGPAEKARVASILGLKNLGGAVAAITHNNIDWAEANEKVRKSEKNLNASIADSEKNLEALKKAQTEAMEGGTLFERQAAATGATLVQWFGGQFTGLMKRWGDTGKIAAKSYIEMGSDITDTNKGMAGTFGSVTSKMLEVQGTIGSVALEGAKLGYSLEESTKVISEAMSDVAISSKGALQAADFKKLGDDTLFYSRVLGIDTTKTLNFFKVSLQKLNKTEEEAADDLMSVRNASDALNKSVGKTVIKSGDFAHMMTEIANNSNKATLNMKSLSNIASVVGAEMTKAGLSTAKTADAMKSFTEFLAKPAEEIDVTAGLSEVEEYTKVAKMSQADLASYVQQNFKDELDGITDVAEKKKKQLEIEQAIKNAGDETVGVYSRAKAVSEALGGSQKGMEARLRAINELYIKGGGPEAANVLVERGVAKDFQSAVALTKMMQKGDFSGVAKEQLAKQKPLAEQKKAIKGNAQAAGAYAGGIDMLPKNIWDAFMSNPFLMGTFTVLSAAALLYTKSQAAESAINILMAFKDYGAKILGGGATAAAGGASSVAGATAVAGEASALVGAGATAAAGEASTLAAATSVASKAAKASSTVAGVLGKFTKKIPIIGSLVTLGLGAKDYSEASTDEEKRGIAGRTAGGIAGGLGGGTIGTILGTILAPFTGGLSLVAGPLIGAALGDWLGGSGGKFIAENFSVVSDMLGDVFSTAIDFYVSGIKSIGEYFAPYIKTFWDEWLVPFGQTFKDLLGMITKPFAAVADWVDTKFNLTGPGSVIGAIKEEFNERTEAKDKKEGKTSPISTLGPSVLNPDKGTAIDEQRVADAQKKQAELIASSGSNNMSSSNNSTSSTQTVNNVGPPSSTGACVVTTSVWNGLYHK